MFVEAIVFGLWILATLALIAWLIAGGLMAGTMICTGPRLLDKILDYKGEHCACYLGFHRHTHVVDFVSPRGTR
jgi:hypothetical protein